MPSQPATPSRRVLGDRYELTGRIDSGGMAEVWHGHDTVLDRDVAVKTLHPHLASSESFMARFRREAVMAARLVHPGIVATYDTGIDGADAFIVMELVEGRSLKAALAEQGRLPPADVAAIGVQIADALDHAHRHGVVHRDVKPANILVCDEAGPAGPRVKVTDFGVAKLLDDNAADLTRTGSVVGTAKYLSPEQVEGGEPDARSDVYALGVVLYEAVCGVAPFAADTDLATAMQHLTTAPTAPRVRCPDIPPGLEAVILRALAKDAADRHQSAAALRDDLLATGLVDDAEPSVARDRTPPAGLAPARAGRRRRDRLSIALAGAGVLGVTLLILGLVIDGGAALRRATGGAGDAAAPVPVAGVTSFDPEGRDGTENDDEALRATDGNPATAWRTDRYETRDFGRLKGGVGIVLRLSRDDTIERVEIEAAGRDWSAAVYVADEPAEQLAGWGEPAARIEAGSTVEQLDVGGRRGQAVLIWITDLGVAGDRYRFELREVRVFA